MIFLTFADETSFSEWTIKKKTKVLYLWNQNETEELKNHSVKLLFIYHTTHSTTSNLLLHLYINIVKDM